jgi:hypothetical protein
LRSSFSPLAVIVTALSFSTSLGKEHDKVRQFLLDVEKFKAGREGVPSSSAHDQEGGGINKGMTMTMTMMAALNFMTMAIVIVAIVCAFIGSGSEIGSRRLFIVNVINGTSCEGGGGYSNQIKTMRVKCAEEQEV